MINTTNMLKNIENVLFILFLLLSFYSQDKITQTLNIIKPNTNLAFGLSGVQADSENSV